MNHTNSLVGLQKAAESTAKAKEHQGQRQRWHTRKAELKAQLSAVRQQLEEAKQKLAALEGLAKGLKPQALNPTVSSHDRSTATEQVWHRAASLSLAMEALHLTNALSY